MRNQSWIFVIVAALMLLALACSGSATAIPETETPEVPLPPATATATATTEATPVRVEMTKEPAPLSSTLSGGGARLELFNDSGETIAGLYISPVESDSWGDNWLPGGGLAAGADYVVQEVDEGQYDLRVTGDDGTSLEILYNVALEAEFSWTAVGPIILPPNADLRFEDDFSDNRNNWGSDQSEEVDRLAPAQGEYCFHIKTDTLTAWEWYEPFRASDFLAEVKCRVEPDTDASCGLGFGPDGDNFFWYEVDAPSQSYALFLLQDDEWQDSLLSWTEAQQIDPNGENYLALSRVGETLNLYVNGTPIMQVNSNLFPTGRIAIGGATYEDSDVTLCLDDLQIWDLTGTPETSLSAPTATSPTPATPLATETAPVASQSAPLEISWSNQMGYEGREDNSRWCEMHMTYQNLSGQTLNWPAYRPSFLIRNGDGSTDGWYMANYYHKEDGWPNGIEGEPQPIAAGASANWTWYSYTDNADQYCAAVTLELQGWTYEVVYNAQGTLVSTKSYAP